MNHPKRKHYRVATKDVHPTPAEGIYVTKKEAKEFCLYTAVCMIFLAILALFPRKR